MPEKYGSAYEAGKLFIGGLTITTTDEILKDFYSQWGKLVDFIVMKDPETKRPRGFGFVTFADRNCAEVAMTHRPHVIEGRSVDVKWAMPRELDPSQQAKPQACKVENNEPTKRIFLSGIKEEQSEDILRYYFCQFGTIESMEIIVDKVTGRCKGFGYITFDSQKAVDECVDMKTHIVGGLRCDVKKALNKEQMAARNIKNQYGRDRIERDNRSRGIERYDGFGIRGHYPSADTTWYQPSFWRGGTFSTNLASAGCQSGNYNVNSYAINRYANSSTSNYGNYHSAVAGASIGSGYNQQQTYGRQYPPSVIKRCPSSIEYPKVSAYGFSPSISYSTPTTYSGSVATIYPQNCVMGTSCSPMATNASVEINAPFREPSHIYLGH